MKRDATTVRLKPGLMSAVKNEQARDRRESQTEMIAILIEDGLASRGVFNFNAGCHKVGMNERRDEFHAWCKDSDVPAYNTIAAWEGFALQFETVGDERDLKATQRGSMV